MQIARDRERGAPAAGYRGRGARATAGGLLVYAQARQHEQEVVETCQSIRLVLTAASSCKECQHAAGVNIINIVAVVANVLAKYK